MVWLGPNGGRNNKRGAPAPGASLRCDHDGQFTANTLFLHEQLGERPAIGPSPAEDFGSVCFRRHTEIAMTLRLTTPMAAKAMMSVTIITTSPPASIPAKTDSIALGSFSHV